MRLGFITNGSVDDVRFAAKYGFGCLELAIFGESPLFERHAGFKSALAGENVALSAVSLFGQNYREKDAHQRQRHLDLWERAADLAAALGARVFVTGSGYAPDEPVEEQWDAIVDELGPKIQAVKARGLEFAFYNCRWANAVYSPAAWRRVLPRLPGAGVKFDPSHPVYYGDDWLVDMRAAGPHILHAHAKDVLKVGGEMIPDPNPGLGQINWGAFFALLYEAGYDGDVCIEPHSAVYTGEKRYAFLLLSRRYLDQFMLPPGLQQF